jgi:hypothetical protein
VMFRGTKHRMTRIAEPLLEDGERIEVMVHLLAGSAGWVVKNIVAISTPWEPVGTVEFGVLTNRRLMIFASDQQGRPAATVLFETPRAGMAVAGTGGGYVRWAEVHAPGWEPFRLFFPPVARREGAELVSALSAVPGDA